MKRTTKYLSILSFCAVVSHSWSQQLPIYSQFYWNDYVINPAATGMNEKPVIQAGVRNQWTGFQGAPATYTLGGHGMLPKQNMGLGGMIFIDDTGGALSQTGIMLNYSYRLKLNEANHLSFGLSGSLNQYVYDGSDIQVQQADAALSANAKQLAPDVNFGLLYMFDNRVRVGFSVNQLLESRLKNLNNYDPLNIADNRLVRHYHLTASYKAMVSEKIDIEPYTLVRATFINPIQFELGARGVFSDKYFAGLGYRYQDAFMLQLGMNVKQFAFGYSYDITTSKLRNYSTGTHELMLGFRFMK
jgi:type IX secretion system PorP/SprF family membrane protein